MTDDWSTMYEKMMGDMRVCEWDKSSQHLDDWEMDALRVAPRSCEVKRPKRKKTKVSNFSISESVVEKGKMASGGSVWSDVPGSFLLLLTSLLLFLLFLHLLFLVLWTLCLVIVHRQLLELLCHFVRAVQATCETKLKQLSLRLFKEYTDLTQI